MSKSKKTKIPAADVIVSLPRAGEIVVRIKLDDQVVHDIARELRLGVAPSAAVEQEIRDVVENKLKVKVTNAAAIIKAVKAAEAARE